MKADNKGQSEVMRAANYARAIERLTGKTVRPYRSDGFVNALNRYGTKKDVTEHYEFIAEPQVSDEILINFYEGNGLFAKIIDTPAEEAVKHGFTLKDLADGEIQDFYEEALDELDWEETAMTALKWARLFGGSIAVMLINDGRGIDEPLDWKHIESIDDIRVYDRSLITPDLSGLFTDKYDDPFKTRGSRLGMPEYYQVNSRYGHFVVHESRCLVFQNGILPENTTSTEYQLWGIPEYIRLKRAIRDAQLAHETGPKMLDRSVQAVYKMGRLSEILATEDGEGTVVKRLEAIDLARGLLNSIVIDKEGEDYDFRQFQFSGVSEVIDSTCDFLSALTSIPQTILFGRSPAGMNSTGESDMENYYNFVQRIQKRMLRRNLRYLLSIIFTAGMKTGEIDDIPSLNPEFNPLWSQSEGEIADLELKRAQTKQTKAQTAQIYVDMQAIDPSEVRKKLASDDEFDVDTVLDDLDEDESDDLFEFYDELKEELGNATNAEGQVAAEGDNPDNFAPESAPTVTKLPQDMTDEEREEIEDNEEEQNTDSRFDDAEINSVGVVVVDNGKILAANRHNDFGYGQLCGPGGKVEDGETPEQAAFRETEEEFGITPKELILLGQGPTEESGFTPNVYLCTEYEGKVSTPDLEMSNPRFMTVEEIQNYEGEYFKPFISGLELLFKDLGQSVDFDKVTNRNTSEISNK